MKYIAIIYRQAYYQTEVEAEDTDEAEVKALQKWERDECSFIDGDTEVVEVKEEKEER